MNPYFTEANKALVLEVAAGNPGALSVTRMLQWFTRWEEMLRWLQDQGYTGPRLWVLYKDTHHQSWSELGHWIKKAMNEKLGTVPKPTISEMKKLPRFIG